MDALLGGIATRRSLRAFVTTIADWGNGGCERTAIRRQIGDLSLQILGLHVRIPLGGGHPGVAQQLLHRPQVRPSAQSVGGEGVAQQVGAGAIGDGGRPRMPDLRWQPPPRRSD